MQYISIPLKMFYITKKRKIMKRLISFMVVMVVIECQGVVGFNRIGYVNVNGDHGSAAYSCVAIDAQGRIVAVGRTDVPDSNGLIARYTAAGLLDTTFNVTGYVNVADALGVNSNFYSSVAIDAQGRIVAVGATDAPANGLIARYTAAGVLDGDFNGTGYVNVDGAHDSLVYNDVVIDAQGKIVAVGGTDNGAGLIARYTAAGGLDGAFNPGSINGALGYVNLPGDHNSFIYYGVAIDAQGRIVVVGQTGAAAGLIARYTAAGVLDTTFNAGSVNGAPGYVNVAGDHNSALYYDVAIDAQGRIVAVGQTAVLNGLIARYTAAGVLDTTFNGTGYVNVDGNHDSNFYYRVAIDAQGRIVVVGKTDANDGLIARYTAAGLLDTAFNGTGYVNVDGAHNSCLYYGVAIDGQGKIVAVGQTDDLGGGAINGLIARYLSNGVLDAESNWNMKNFRESCKSAGISIGLLNAA